MDRLKILAQTLLDGEWTLASIEERIRRITRPKSRARKKLGAEIHARFQSPPSRSALIEFLTTLKRGLCSKLNWSRIENDRQFRIEPSTMRRVVAPTFARTIPALPTVGAFADWCGLSVGLVDWLSEHRKKHYRVSTTPKRLGGLRILESPRLRLKGIQRMIASGLLQCIPCHASAHGFVRGRSAISYVLPHTKKEVVLRMDLQDFFPSIDASRVFGFFRWLGYPYAVTQLLTDLCTSCCTEDKIREITAEHFRFQSNRESLERLRLLYCRKHLPQGAPTSPTLANLIAYRLDCRLSGLAANAGVSYTRYADDLLFSGTSDFGRFAKSFAIKVGAIAIEEGFQVQFRKTRIMRAATRQSAAGIVLNQGTNAKRSEFDLLKAILYNSVRSGPSTQNHEGVSDFQSHLRGRINWVRQLNPARGEKLMAMFHSIDWSR